MSIAYIEARIEADSTQLRIVPFSVANIPCVDVIQTSSKPQQASTDDPKQQRQQQQQQQQQQSVSTDEYLYT